MLLLHASLLLILLPLLLFKNDLPAISTPGTSHCFRR